MSNDLSLHERHASVVADECEQEAIQENPFRQLCVLQGVQVGADHIDEFVEIMKDKFGVRVKYEAEVLTNPDLDGNGNPVPDTGGRTDLMFYVHAEDTMKFAVPRLQAGIRWWEDVVKYNNNSYLYSKEFLEDHPPMW